jgi:hypothetical protein
MKPFGTRALDTISYGMTWRTLTTASSIILALVASFITHFPSNQSENQLLLLYAGAIFACFAAVTSVIAARRVMFRQAAKRVFILYSHRDRAAAIHVSNLLANARYEPWLDVHQLLPGQVWSVEIFRALRDSGAAIVIVSENLNKSEFVKLELAALVKQFRSGDASSTPIIPIRIDDALPPDELADIQWLDLREDGSTEQLLRGLAFVTHAPAAPVGDLERGRRVSP